MPPTLPNPAASLAALANRNDVNAPGGPAGGIPNSASGGAAGAESFDPLQHLVDGMRQAGADLIADLQYALALASYKDPAINGTPADPAGMSAYAALIPLVQLVINGPPAGEGAVPMPPDGKPRVITDLEKFRIVQNRFSDPGFKNAMAPLIQDIQSKIGLGGGVLLGGGNALSLVGGVGKILGLALPLV